MATYPELLATQNEMYKKASELFANDLYDELISLDVLDDGDIWCGQTDNPITLTEFHKSDRNYILWSLIPYIAALSAGKPVNEKISFEEVATIRSDGSHNIFHASVVAKKIEMLDDYVYMKNRCGPMWSGNDTYILWKVDNEWSGRDEHYLDSEESRRILSLYEREADGRAKKIFEYIDRSLEVKQLDDYFRSIKT